LEDLFFLLALVEATRAPFAAPAFPRGRHTEPSQSGQLDFPSWRAQVVLLFPVSFLSRLGAGALASSRSTLPGCPRERSGVVLLSLFFEAFLSSFFLFPVSPARFFWFHDRSFSADEELPLWAFSISAFSPPEQRLIRQQSFRGFPSRGLSEFRNELVFPLGSLQDCNRACSSLPFLPLEKVS